MLKYSSLIVVIILALFVCVYQVQSKAACTKTPFSNFDYFVFVISNQNTYCNGNSKCIPSKLKKLNQENKWFSIHGLWPQLNNPVNINAYDKSYSNCPKNYPQFCTQENFNENGLGALKFLMENEAWQLVSGPDLWQHEWKKHGTCALRSLNPDSYIDSQFKYFKASVDLFFLININQKLLRANITPNNNNGVSIKKLNQALLLNVEPKYRFKEVNGIKYLQEIWFCVSKTGALIQCPNSLNVSYKASAGDSLILPTMPIVNTGANINTNTNSEYECELEE